MARWSALCRTMTPTAVGDTANFTAPFLALKGGSSTQRTSILEVYMGGQAGASSPSIMVLARDSTVGSGATNGGFFNALDPATAALAAPPITKYNDAGATQPQRLAGSDLLNLSFNAFGGIVRWVAAPGEEVGLLGNTANFGEVSLTPFTGGTPGLMGAHLVVEPF